MIGKAGNSIAGLLAALCTIPMASAQTVTDIERMEIARFVSALDESSGLAFHDGSLWTHNDSGDEARVFQLDLSGTVLREIVIRNADNVDWESMAQDEDYLYIADTGNNFNTRSTLLVYRVSWADLQDNTAAADIISIDYADHEPGNRLSHNFDAEGLAVHDDELWLFSKNRGDRQTKLYRFSKLPGHYRPRPAQTLDVDSLVTGADIDPDSGDVILLSSRRERETYLWRAPTTEHGVDWDAVRVFRLHPSDQWEAILWDPQQPGRVYLTHENNVQDYAGLSYIDLK